MLQPGRDRSKMTDIPKFEGRDREWRGYLNIPLESRRGIPFAFRVASSETGRGRGTEGGEGDRDNVYRIRPSSNNHPPPSSSITELSLPLHSPFFYPNLIKSILSALLSQSIISQLSQESPFLINNSSSSILFKKKIAIIF